MSLGLKKIPIFCSYCSFSSQRLYIYWKEIWHTCRFTIILFMSSSILGMIKQFLMELYAPLTSKKIAIFCSFHLFSSERLHIIKWNFVYSLIIIKSIIGLRYTPYSCINILQFPFILFAEILHTHWIKFGIPVQIYHNNV